MRRSPNAATAAGEKTAPEAAMKPAVPKGQRAIRKPPAARPSIPSDKPAADDWLARALDKLRVGSPTDRAAILGEAPTALVGAAKTVVGLSPSSGGASDQDVVLAGSYLDMAGLSALPERLATVRATLKPGAVLIAHVRTFAAPEPAPSGGGHWDHLLFPAMTRSGEITGEAAGLTPLFISGWVMALESAGFRLLALAGPSGEATAEMLLARHAERLAVFDTREIAATELLIIARIAA